VFENKTFSMVVPIHQFMLINLHSGSMQCGQGEVALNHILIHSICLQPEESTSTHHSEQGMAYGWIQAQTVGSKYHANKHSRQGLCTKSLQENAALWHKFKYSENV
jgi:hypothetical protein